MFSSKNNSIILSKSCKLLEWIFFLALFAVSFWFTKDVFDKYLAYDSSFKMFEEPISSSEGPTIIFGFMPPKNEANGKYFEHGKDFTFSFVYYKNDVDIWVDIPIHQNLSKGSHFIDNGGKMKIQVKYEELNSYSSVNGPSIKISSNFTSKSMRALYSIKFNPSILEKNLPNVVMTIVSENNVYGIYKNYLGDYDYFEGQELIIPGEFGKMQYVKFQTQKHIFLDKSQSPKSSCQFGTTFYEYFDATLIEEIAKKCPIKCLPYVSGNHSIPTCNTENDNICAYNTFNEVQNKDSFMKKPTHSCIKIQYDQTYLWEKSRNISKNEFWFGYSLANERVRVMEQYLIYDAISMIGSVGGTLGLFIGFSFRDVISLVINMFQNWISHFMSKS